jgi:G3E family GTPase
MVTVVDAVNLLRDFSSHDFLSDRGESLGEQDERTLVNLLTDQIEFADVVILNKTSDAGPTRTDAARKIIKALNPDARLIETNHSRVDAAAIFDTGLFDFDRAHEHSLWAKELYGFAHHTPETEEYGISSFVYRARRPFHPQRIHDVASCARAASRARSSRLRSCTCGTSRKIGTVVTPRPVLDLLATARPRAFSRPSATSRLGPVRR